MTMTDCDWDKRNTSNSDTEIKLDQSPPCMNLGNPVFPCLATSLSKSHMILYKTNPSDKVNFLSMPQFLPCNYTPKEQAFSSHIRATGFYQNNSLNITPDTLCENTFLLRGNALKKSEF